MSRARKPAFAALAIIGAGLTAILGRASRAWYQLPIARDPLAEAAQKALHRVDKRLK